MKTILITGIHGFVGSNIVKALGCEYIINGVDVVTDEKDYIKQTYTWDELDTLPKADTIIHLAGKAHDTKNNSKVQEYFDINYGLTKKIFNYFLSSDARIFIFFSSVKAAADSVIGDYLTEDVIPKPIGPYGKSKIKAEEYLLSKEWGEKKVYIFRPCMIHGPGNKGNLNLLYQIVKKGVPWPLGAFNNNRSFLNIWNLSFIIEQFIIKQPESGIYHLADDDPVSTNDLVELISLSMKKKISVWNWNKKVIQKVAEIGTFLNLPLNAERLRKLTENYVVCNKKVKQAIRVEELPVNVTDGFMRTLVYFKDR